MRFECPRCQTIFTHDKGDDDAFVECPSCGALAMSAGEATGVDSDALARTLSSTHDVSSFQNSDPSGAARSQSDDDSSRDDEAVSREDSERVARPGPGIFADLLGGSGLSDDEPAPPPPIHSAPDFGDDEDSVRQSRPSLDEPTAERSAEASIDLGLDDELGDFDLPSTKPGAKALSPATKAPLRKKAHEEAKPAPPPPPPEVAASLSDDAMGALEAAFDNLASAPVAASSRGGLTEDERMFLENIAGAPPPPPPPTAAPPRKAPPRPPQKPGVPRAAPPPLRKKSSGQRPPLSDEAIEAAFVRLRRAPSVIGDGIEGLPPALQMPADPEITAPGHHAPPRPAPKPAPAPAAARSEEPAPKKRPVIVREKPTVFGGLSKGLVAAGVLVGLIAGGAVGAATAPAQVKRNDGRARAELAVADGNRYYEVARYDDALGKFKNAINNDRSYAPAHKAKGAALAKQAQVAAQTQQNDTAQRLWDEAADAYREYLALEPSAIDGADIKAAIGRRGLEPVKTGPSGGSDG